LEEFRERTERSENETKEMQARIANEAVSGADEIRRLHAQINSYKQELQAKIKSVTIGTSAIAEISLPYYSLRLGCRC
jgi:hypothetical protein